MLRGETNEMVRDTPDHGMNCVCGSCAYEADMIDEDDDEWDWTV